MQPQFITHILHCMTQDTVSVEFDVLLQSSVAAAAVFVLCLVENGGKKKVSTAIGQLAA